MPDRASKRASVATHKNGDFGAISRGTVRSNDARVTRTSTKSRFSRENNSFARASRFFVHCTTTT